MRLARTSRLWALAVVVLGGALVAQLASAAPPPPPDFWDFTISNTTGAEVTNIEVRLYTAEGPKYETLSTSPIMLQIPKLGDGASMVVTLKKVYCIAKITADAKCGGKALTPMLDIEADKGDWDGDGAADLEYAGFCYSAPSGSTSYKPELVFSKASNKFKGQLRGKWRWADHWPTTPKTSNGVFK